MVRTYIRKTEKINAENLLNAIKDVKTKKFTVSAASRIHKIAQPTLWRYVNKDKQANLLDARFYNNSKTIFTFDQETALAKHVLHLADIYHGLSPTKVRLLAYEYAKRLEIVVPVWEKAKIGRFQINKH